MAANIYTEILSLGRAKVLTDTLAGQTNDEQVVLRFDNIPNNQLEAAADWLYSNRISISDFKSEYKTYGGTWRSVEIVATKESEKGGHIEQTFAHGYLETLLTGSDLDWTEARSLTRKSLVAGPTDNSYTSPATGDDTTEEYLTAIWPNCSPYKAEAMLAEINAFAASSYAPVLRGETYSTGWHRIFSGYELAEDGSATITMYLAHPEFSIDTYEGWLTEKQASITYHYNVPKELAQTIVDNYKAKGIRASSTYNDGLCNLIVVAKSLAGSTLDVGTTAYSCDSQSYERLYLSIEYPSLYTVPDPEAGMTYGRRVSSNGDGTYDVKLESTYRQERSYPDRESEVSALSDTSVYRQFGVTGTGAIPDISTPTQGRTYRQNITIRPDCSKDIETNTTDSRNGKIPFRSDSTTFRTGESIIYRNSKSVIEAPPATGSGQYSVQQQANQDGTYDAVLLYQYGTNTGHYKHEGLNSGLLERDNVIYKARTSGISAPASGQGAIYRADNSLREDGLYDANLSYEKSNAVALYRTAASTPFSITRGAIYRNSRSVIDAPPTDSGIYRVTEQINDDGTYDVDVTYVYSTGAGEATFESMNSPLSERSTTIYRAAATASVAPNPATGYVYRAENELSEDGLYNSRVTSDASQYARTTISSGRTPISSSNQMIYRNTTTMPSITTPSVGQVYRMTATINEDGTYDADVTYDAIAGTGASHAFQSAASAATDQNSIVYRRSTNALAGSTTSQGKMYRVNQSILDDGTYQGEVSYRESSPLLYKQIFNGRYGNNYIYAFRNATSIEGIADALPYRSRNDIRFQTNDDGTYSGNATYSAPRGSGDVFAGQNVSWADYEFQTVYGGTHYLYWTATKAVTWSATHTGAQNDLAGSSEGSVNFEHGLWKAMYKSNVSRTGPTPW